MVTALLVVRGALPTMTPDGHYLVGPVPGRDGLWTIGGCNVAGRSTSPALGEDLASFVHTGRRPDRIAPFALDRFGDEPLHAEALRRACRRTYVDKYSADEVSA